MTYSLINCEEGVDTVALQSRHPEFFNVSSKHGVARWTLRLDVRGAQTLTLEVEFGPQVDVQAHVNWADARVIP